MIINGNPRAGTAEAAKAPAPAARVARAARAALVVPAVAAVIEKAEAMTVVSGQGRERPDELPEDGPLGKEDLLEPRNPVPDAEDPDEEDDTEEVDVPPLDPDMDDTDDLPPRE